MGGRVFEFYTVTNIEDLKYVKYGKKELAFVFNDNRFLNCKNVANKFKKHLGFITSYMKVPNGEGFRYEHRIIIHDKKKLMLFRIKYGL